MILGSHETAPARHVFWVQDLNVLVSVGMDKKILFWDIQRNLNNKPAFDLTCTEVPLVAAHGFGEFAYSDRKNTTMITKWDFIKAPSSSMQRSIF
jgi:mRNA export factor